jgi:hypothetical protein
MEVWISSPSSYDDFGGGVDSRGRACPDRKLSPIRVLLALDNGQDGECLLAYVKLLASTGEVTALVLHVVEPATVVGFSTIETTEEAHAFLNGAVFALQVAGVHACGELR